MNEMRTASSVTEKYEDSSFIKVLSFIYQAASNSFLNHDRERLIETALSSMMSIRERERDDRGNKLTWDDAALRWFEGVIESMYKNRLLKDEGRNLTLDEWLYVMLHERGDKEGEA